MSNLLQLLEHGAITASQAMAALQLHLESPPPLLKLALFRDLLSAKKLAEVLAVQSAHPEMALSALLVDQGYCTPAQLAELRSEQAARTLPLDQALLAVGALTVTDLERMLGSRWAA